MADILSFKPATRPSASRKAVKADAPTAQILFFTGVRYERRDTSALKAPRKRKHAPSVPADAAIGS
jgi:hypothetical protein